MISKDSLSIVQFEVVPKSIQYDTENAPSVSRKKKIVSSKLVQMGSSEKNGDCPTATSQPVLIQGGGQSSSATVRALHFFFFPFRFFLAF